MKRYDVKFDGYQEVPRRLWVLLKVADGDLGNATNCTGFDSPAAVAGVEKRPTAGGLSKPVENE